MSARVEVLPGPGTVIRFGELTVWAGPGVSADLLSFLQRSASNVAASPSSGRQVVDHVAGILTTHDPEPGAPFAVVGPDGAAWVALLHGPVLAWDGTRWLAPTPDPGWLRATVAPQPAFSIGPAGSPSPRLVVDSPYDLNAGMVPGGGVIILPRPGAAQAPPGAALAPEAEPAPGAVPAPGTVPASGTVPAPESVPGPEATPGAGTASGPGTASPAGAGPALAGTGQVPAGTAARTGPAQSPPLAAAHPTSMFAPVPGPNAPTADPGRIVDLRRPQATTRPPLPAGLLPAPPGRPDVDGIRCERGHFNHPSSSTCARCRLPIAPGRPPVTGPRPTLGLLLADDGAVYRVAHDLLVGADPAVDHTVSGGNLAGLTLRSDHALLAPAHTELRLHDWTLRAVDRGSAAGTFVVVPGRDDWTRLEPYTPVDVPPGSHLSIGQRVLTFLSPWPG